MADRIRIQKAIAHAGLMSRREAEEAIAAGRVQVNGREAVLGDRIDVASEALTLDGVPVPIAPDLVTYLLYKPPGVVSTTSDPQGRRTVIDLIDTEKRVYPVGRLDADSEGLILVTNDGELTNRVTHPRYGITKKYLAHVEGTPTRATLARLRSGVMLDDGPARAVSATLKESHQGKSLVEVVMVEGRNREVRRMMAAVGHQVQRLVRTAIGPLSAPDLTPGEYRELSSREIRRMLEAGGAG
ncbi:MAG: pseudouridine synthase [Acidimicrobiia bacterium]|nr:pseudouridine synthase [Acidimicrobiia bacterium]